MAVWKWWHQGSGPDEYRIRELLRAIWDFHAVYGADDPWQWRGQANASYRIEPGMHTRARRADDELSDHGVSTYTEGLIEAARRAQVDQHEQLNLPDIALLSLLQHHGAATPLLDVTLDPVVALYMAVVSPDPADDEADGALFAIRKPTQVIQPFDSRSFATIYEELPPDGCVYFSAPDVSDRLRIQRGHFLLGRVSSADTRVTIPLEIEPRGVAQTQTWLARRMQARGRVGVGVPTATSDIAVFRITAKFKIRLRTWLEQRSGLTKEFVYPTAWHQPHLDQFARSHGRLSPI